MSNQRTTRQTNRKAEQDLAQAGEAVRRYLDIPTLQTRGRDALDFHEISVASIRDVIEIAFRAGYQAAGGVFPEPIPTDPDEILATLRITKTSGRKVGGTWVHGTMAGHAFEALVFPEHATDPAFELDDSRISKLWIRSEETGEVVASFERGWDMKPATEMAKAIVDLRDL